MTRFVALAVLLATTPACGMQMRQTTRTNMMLAGALLVVGGLAVAQDTTDDGVSRPPGLIEGPGHDSPKHFAAATLLLASGLTLLGVGGSARSTPEAPAPVVLTAARPPSSIAPQVALPAVETSPVVLRMAQQARSAATRGRCAAARQTVRDIEQRDARYADALRTGPIMAICE